MHLKAHQEAGDEAHLQWLLQWQHAVADRRLKSQADDFRIPQDLPALKRILLYP